MRFASDNAVQCPGLPISPEEGHRRRPVVETVPRDDARAHGRNRAALAGGIRPVVHMDVGLLRRSKRVVLNRTRGSNSDSIRRPCVCRRRE